jgi:hypothetical protein
MEQLRRNEGKRPGLVVLIVAIIAVGIVAAAVYMGIRKLEETGLLDTKEQQPEPPPPSDKLPGAPGPDNLIQELPPQPGVPAQPPSPIDSETDPSKKPKEAD